MICYFECSSGISGDMILGALIDAGVSSQKLKKGLSYLPIKGYKLNIKKIKRAGFKATKVDVVLKSEVRSQKSEVKKWKDIEKIIRTSSLSKEIKQKGLLIFRRLFEAEAKVHGEKFNDIHLHELGAIDCIVDIFVALIGLDILGIDKIYSSPLNLGSGTVKTEHGILPVPAPATIELLREIPVYTSNLNFELTTPTGAALISTLAESFGQMLAMQFSKIGAGAGSKDFKKHSNVLRVFIGEEVQNPPSPPFSKGGIMGGYANGRYTPLPPLNRGELCPTLEKGDAGGFLDKNITVIETNIDDMNPQIYEYVIEKLFKAGALDVFLTQIIMKKGRPGVRLTVLCSDDKKERLTAIIFRETTSIGIRFYEVQRKILDRKIMSVDTKYGKIKVKVSKYGDDVVKITPEYEDCKKIAKKLNIPLIEIVKAVKVKSL